MVSNLRIADWVTVLTRKRRGSKLGISTIMANLTMLVIVVSLSSLLFVWAVSSFGAYQGGAGYWFSSRSIANQERVSMENVGFGSTGSINNIVTVFVRNVGTIPFNVTSVYVNSTLTQVSYRVLVNQVQSIPIILTTPSLYWTHGAFYTITVATLRGTTVAATWVS